MSYHEPRLQPGDPGAAPLAQVIVFVDDNGRAHYPGDEGYVEPEEGSAEFLADQAQQLAEDQHRIAAGQAQQFTPEQVANTQAEADRITDPTHPMQGAEQQNVPAEGGEQSVIQTDVNATFSEPQAQRVPSGEPDPNDPGSGRDVEPTEQPPSAAPADPNAPRRKVPVQVPAEPPPDPNQ